jgi:autotransporter passenger strand-loop-strand repeat protein
VSSGAQLDVLSGGIGRATVVGNGGLEVVLGTASGTMLAGTAYVYGTASDNTVLNGGVERVGAGGVLSGGTVSSGGLVVVSSGGGANGVTLSSGSELDVLSGGNLGGTTLSGGFVELKSGGTAGASQINFATSAGGTLQLDDSVHFNGVISGFGVPGALDLRDIAFGSGTTLGFTEAGDNLSGTLTVSDGINTANITLLGQYVAGNFTKQSDGNGGTLITDPPVPDSFMLTGSPWTG